MHERARYAVADASYLLGMSEIDLYITTDAKPRDRPGTRRSAAARAARGRAEERGRRRRPVAERSGAGRARPVRAGPDLGGDLPGSSSTPTCRPDESVVAHRHLIGARGRRPS